MATALFSQATLRFALLGLATGSLTALVALSVVIVYRVSGVLNFAAAALGRGRGLRLLLAARRSRVAGTPAAVAAGLGVGVLLGLVTYAVMAALRESSLLGRV